MIHLSGPQGSEEPFSRINAKISTAFQLRVGFFKKEYANQDPDCKNYSADKVG